MRLMVMMPGQPEARAASPSSVISRQPLGQAHARHKTYTKGEGEGAR